MATNEGFASRANARPFRATRVSRGAELPVVMSSAVTDLGAREILASRDMIDRETLEPRTQREYMEACIEADRIVASVAPDVLEESVDEKQARAFHICATAILTSRGVTAPSQEQYAEALQEAGYYDGTPAAA